MSDTRVSLLTPPGAGAIATVAVAGPGAWEVARRLFRPAGPTPLPDTPPLHRVWFGRLGEGVGDEVVLAVTRVEPEPRVEAHCHGGRRVVRWVIEQFLALGCVETEWMSLDSVQPPRRGGGALWELTRATTLRTASILLDQYHGGFDRAVRAILADPEAGRKQLAALAAFAPVGRHLVEPWKVVVAGPPSVGKSSLVNALAGYQRSVVSETPGTTRDVVTVPVAFDGWPVELADTAGLRSATGLEAEGIDRAKRSAAAGDLTVWVFDATTAEPEFPPPSQTRTLYVVNKVDQPPGWDFTNVPDAPHVSAATGEGVPGLAAAIARTLVPHPPEPGAAVPFTPYLADLIEAARAAGRPDAAARFLREAISPG